MKLNFWQWLGVILLVIGAIGYFIYKEEPAPAKPPVPSTTQPMQ